MRDISECYVTFNTWAACILGQVRQRLILYTTYSLYSALLYTEKTRKDPRRPEKTRKDPKRPEKTRKDALIYTEKTRKDALIYTEKTRKDPRRPEKTRKDPKRHPKRPKKTRKDIFIVDVSEWKMTRVMLLYNK